MTRLYVVAEGLCEEAFVRSRLQPHLGHHHVWVEPIVVTTSRDAAGQKHRGGGHWKQWRSDIERVYREQAGPGAWVTTMFDLYGLPSDFPDLTSIRVPGLDGASKVKIAEEALERSIREFSEGRWFIPYVQQYEFESLVLACLEDLDRMLDAPGERKGIVELRAALGETPPEDVNDGLSSAPSKRLSRHLPGYQKRLYSEYALCDVSLEALGQRCPHFGRWLSRLEALS